MNPLICTLQETDRASIEAHLLRLSPEDRSLRFSAGLVSDDTVRRYAASMRLDSDLVLGLRDEHGVLIALAHGCVFEARQQTQVEAAFSVDAAWRGQGLGSRLMAALLARSRELGPCKVVGFCLARNMAMRRIFEGAQMAMTREDDEWHAHCDLAPEPGRKAHALREDVALID